MEQIIFVRGVTTQSNRRLIVPNGTRRPNTRRPSPPENPPVIFLNRTLRTSSGERRPNTIEEPVTVNRILRVPTGTRR